MALASILNLEDFIAKCSMDFSKLQEDVKVAKDQMKAMEEREKKYEEFPLIWNDCDVQVVAKEILKWSYGKRSVKDRDGRHLFALEAALLVTISNSSQAGSVGRKNIHLK
jgi:hypothetical protein